MRRQAIFRERAMKDSVKDIFKLILKISVIIIIMTLAIVYYDELTRIDVREIAASAQNELTAALSVIAIYSVKGVLFVIPAALVYISVGMAFSPLKAVLINFAGITAEITISYLIGLFLGGDYVEKMLLKNEKSKKLLELKDKHKQSTVFIVRCLPVFPIDFSSLFFGSMKTGFIKYLVFSLLGLAPRVILFTIFGDAIYDCIPMSLIIKIIICLIPVAVIAIIISWAVKKKKSKKE